MSDLNNPAGRLHAILKFAKEQAGGVNALEVWHRVLKVKQGDSIEFLKRYGQMQSLVGDTFNDLLETGAMGPNHYPMKWATQFQRAFTEIRLKDSQWSVVRGFINADVLDGIENASYLLAQKKLEASVQDDELNDIKTRVDSLLTEVKDGAVEPHLREVITRNLENIQNAIELRWLQGANPIAGAAAIASVQVDRHIELKQSEFGNKLIELITYILFTIVPNVGFYSGLDGPELLVVIQEAGLGPKINRELPSDFSDNFGQGNTLEMPKMIEPPKAGGVSEEDSE